MDKGRGFLQMRKSAFFGAKNFGFYEICGVSARTRGRGVLSQCGKEEGQFFVILCGRHLWTAPNYEIISNNVVFNVKLNSSLIYKLLQGRKSINLNH